MDVFYVASKIFWMIADPLPLSVSLGALAFLLALFRRHRLAVAVGGVALAVIVIATCTNVGELLLAPLEDQYPTLADPPRVDGIILLGGAIDGEVSAFRRSYELTSAADRFVETLRLAEHYPSATVVVTGGVGDLDGQGDGDAVAAERFFAAFAISPERLILETASRNTAQNATNVAALGVVAPGTTWLLVTSASHMPRAWASFARAGLSSVVPWPVDYYVANRALRFSTPNAANLGRAEAALREWIGLLAYRITSR